MIEIDIIEAMKRFTPNEVLIQLREKARTTTAKEFARDVGVSEQFLSTVLNGHRPISDRLAAALGLQKEITFVRIKK